MNELGLAERLELVEVNPWTDGRLRPPPPCQGADTGAGGRTAPSMVETRHKLPAA
ncbi:hypothetical protein [Archangium lipolyticum]|uniref:hypothetical protein n=1 Tax=Archangium lipolyticum TaxID=2970465 RepID=UPI00214A49B9|nr:hypothetical protein [Archangium lipolyticum]